MEMDSNPITKPSKKGAILGAPSVRKVPQGFCILN